MTELSTTSTTSLNVEQPSVSAPAPAPAPAPMRVPVPAPALSAEELGGSVVAAPLHVGSAELRSDVVRSGQTTDLYQVPPPQPHAPSAAAAHSAGAVSTDPSARPLWVPHETVPNAHYRTYTSNCTIS
jgi:hypothetical protein